MFVDGSYPRPQTYWNSYGTAQTATAVGVFHRKGEAANLVAIDGHAETFRDFEEYDVPWQPQSGYSGYEPFRYYLPKYWYDIHR